jgi:hypothetical protein
MGTAAAAEHVYYISQHDIPEVPKTLHFDFINATNWSHTQDMKAPLQTWS